MPATVLFDTNIWTDLLLGDEAEQRRVQHRLAELRTALGSFVVATSRICIAESLVAARRELDAAKRAADEALLWVQFQNPNLRVVELTDLIHGQTVNVSDLAAELRAQMIRRTKLLAPHAGVPDDGGKLKLPDAIVAASCFHFSSTAVLLTKNRKDFEVADRAGAKAPLPGLLLEGL